MDITLEQAYEAALATIGRLTIEQHFYREQLAKVTDEQLEEE